MYPPFQEAGCGFALRFAGLLRLPFEFGACLGVELLARFVILLDGLKPLSGGVRNVSASELRSCDPTTALGLALLPFIPAFRRSVCDGAWIGRDAIWAAYEEQAKDATKLALETDWPKVARIALQWLLFALARFWKVHVRRIGTRLLNQVLKRCGRELPTAADSSFSRERVIDLLTRSLQVQRVTQQTISDLARKLINQDRQKLPFMAAHELLLEVNLPKDPLEEVGLSEASIPQLLADFEGDGEVMALAGQFLTCPAGRGDLEAAQKLTVDKLVEIHQFMEARLRDVVTEFLQLPADKQGATTAKQREVTAELLVSMAVESELAVHSEDAELAVLMHDEHLQQNEDFVKCTEQLANMMQTLTAAPLDRA